MFIETNQDCSSGNESINMAKYYYGVITVHGKDEKTYKLSSDVTFGRLGKCDIRLEGKSVSREHAKISIDENGCCYLENMSHTNPTELNGEKVCGLVKLHDKDKIMIGDISIHYNAPDDDETTVITVSKEALQPTVVSTVVERRLNTPLKRAIAARRRDSNMLPPVMNIQDKPVFQIKTPIKVLSTPMKAAILKRRKTIITDTSLELAPVAITEPSMDKSVEKSLSPKTPEQKITPHPPVLTPVPPPSQRKMMIVMDPPISQSKTTTPQVFSEKRTPYSLKKLTDCISSSKNAIKLKFFEELDNKESSDIDSKWENGHNESFVQVPMLFEDCVNASVQVRKSISSGIKNLQQSYPDYQEANVESKMIDDAVKTTSDTVKLAKHQKFCKQVTSRLLSLTRRHIQPFKHFGRRIQVGDSLLDPTWTNPRKPLRALSNPNLMNNDQVMTELNGEVPPTNLEVVGTCAQMVVDAFASEFQLTTGAEVSEAYEQAVNHFLTSPVRSDLEAVDCKDSVKCSLIDSLTDAELELIDAYSNRLEDAGVDTNQAQALSVHSFVRGVTSFHASQAYVSNNKSTASRSKIHLRWDEDGNTINNSVYLSSDGEVLDQDMNETSTQVPFKTPMSIKKNEVIDDNSLFFGASLRNLFHEIGDCTQDQSDCDMEFVQFYALQMSSIAGIDPDLAYGVALDSYISEPEAFRNQMISLGANGVNNRDQIQIIQPRKSTNIKEDEVVAEPKLMEVSGHSIKESISSQESPAMVVEMESIATETDSQSQLQVQSIMTTESKTETVANPVVTLEHELLDAVEVIDSSSTNPVTEEAVNIVIELPSNPPVKAKATRTKKEKPLESVQMTENSFVNTIKPSSNYKIAPNISQKMLKSEMIPSTKPAFITKESKRGVKKTASSITVETDPSVHLQEAAANKIMGEKEEVKTLAINTTSSGEVKDTKKVEESVQTSIEVKEVEIPTRKRGRATLQTSVISLKKQEEEEEEEELVILCDSCDGEFTLEEAHIGVVPEGDWFCSSCLNTKTNKNSAKTKGSKVKVQTVNQTNKLSADTVADLKQETQLSQKRSKTSKETAASVNVVQSEPNLPRRSSRRH